MCTCYLLGQNRQDRRVGKITFFTKIYLFSEYFPNKNEFRAKSWSIEWFLFGVWSWKFLKGNGLAVPPLISFSLHYYFHASNQKFFKRWPLFLMSFSIPNVMNIGLLMKNLIECVGSFKSKSLKIKTNKHGKYFTNKHKCVC